MSNVTVTVRTDDEGRNVVTVSVASTSKARLSSSTDINPGAATGAQHLQALVSAAGSACAEYLNEKFRENHNPGECGRLAIEDFQRECRLMAELSRGAKEKVEAMLSGPLDSLDREVLQKYKWKVDKGIELNLDEAARLNRYLAARSRKKL